MLKEYIARGTYIYPPAAVAAADHRHLRVLRGELPKWNTISISGYHMAEAGATPAQEIAFTLANGIEYVKAAIASGQDVDDFAPRLAFFFVSRTTTCSRRSPSSARRGGSGRGSCASEFGAKNPKSLMLRFHTQTAGVQLTAQQPEVNLVRVAVQALAAVLGRDAEPAHQLLRRGHRAAHREGRPPGPAHPAGDRLRDRRLRHGRPVRRLVRRRVADRRHRGGGVRAHRPDRRARRCGGGHRARLPEGRDRALGLPDRQRDRLRRARGGGGQQVHHRQKSPTSRCGSTPPSRPSSGRAWPRCAPSVATSAACSRRSARPRRARRTSSTR